MSKAVDLIGLSRFWNNVDKRKADKRGVYPDLVAGDLAGRGESVPAEFSFRASGGKSIKDGRAYIKRIKGNSVVWNQKVKGELRVQDGTMSQSGNRYTITPTGEYAGVQTEIATMIQGHKYICLCSKVGGGKPLYLNWGGYDSLANAIFEVTNVNKVNCTIYAINETETFTLTRPIIVDLTQEFQAGNEPTTIEEYEARKPIVADEYAYNEGEVIHCNTESIKSVGDNAWDEEWEIGALDHSNGKESISSTRIRSKNFCRIIGGEDYYLIGYNYNIVLYDENYQWLDYWGAIGEPRKVSIDSRARWFKVSFDANYGTTYKNDALISLYHSGWKAEKDDQYQPYWEDTLPLPIRKCFPDGMKSAGSAHDEIRYNKASGKWEAVQRVTSLDLGSLAWLSAAEGHFYVENVLGNIVYRNLLCPKYTIGVGQYSDMAQDKTIGNNRTFPYNQSLFVRDDDYNDAASFKAAMQGVILYYELAEPVIREIDEPIGTDYRVADFGTEQAISSTPSAPFSADIIYQFNAVDMIRELWLKVQELESRLNNGGL